MDANHSDDSRIWADKAREAARHMRILDQWAVATRRGTREFSGLAHELEELAWSVEQRPTLGLYGESQCGKSYLVSGMAVGGDGSGKPEGGGVKGMRFIASGCKDESRKSRDFVAELDPGEGEESTGVICRFIRREDPSAVEAAARFSPSGTLIARISTLAELMASIGVGYKLELLRLHLKTAGRDATSLEGIESLDPERIPDAWEHDAEDLMLQVERAHRDLEREYESDRSSLRDPPPPIGGQSPAKGKSWPEILRWGIEQRRRPRLQAREGEMRLGGAPFTRFVEAMWWWEPQSTAIWRKLFAEYQSLGAFAPDFSTVAIPVEEAVKGPDRPPVTSVAWFDPLLMPDKDRKIQLGVRTRDGWRPVASSRAKLAGLMKELRVVVDGSGHAGDPMSGIDVLDFPGLRPASPEKRFDTVTESAATWAFRRGKLRLLFRTASSHFDPTMLGICVAVGQNIEARTEMQDDIGIWLKRSDHAKAERPPLVVAITKADLLDKPANGWKVSKPIERLKISYSPQADGWMDRFGTTGQPFDQIYWVYNPFKALLKPKSKAQFLAESGDLTNKHVRAMNEQAEDLFDPTSCGMGYLQRGILEVAKGIRRDRMIREQILERIDKGRRPIAAVVRDPDKDELFQKAQRDADALIGLLEREESIEDFPEVLLALQISPEDVNHAFNHAMADEAGGPDQSRRRERKFDRFFADLRSRASRRLAEREARHPFWQAAPDPSEDHPRRIVDKYFGPMAAPDPLLRKRIETIWQEFERDGAVRIKRDALAAMVSTVWNRSVVEPELDPPVEPGVAAPDPNQELRELARRAVSARAPTVEVGRIRLREANAASRKILDGWKKGGLRDSFRRRFDPQFNKGKNDPRVNDADADLGAIVKELAERLSGRGASQAS